MRRRRRRALLWGLGALVALAALFLVPTLWLRPWAIDHFYARVFLSYALRHPMLLTGLGMLDGTPLDFHSDRLDDLSLAFEEKEARFAVRQLATLRGYDRSRMSPARRLSADVLEWFLVNQIENHRFRFHDYPVNQLFGIQSSLPDFLMNTHPMKRPRDAENYVRRVARFGVAFDQVLEGLEARKERGVVPPRFVIRAVLAEMRAFAAHEPRRNPLFTTFQARADTLRGLDPGTRRDLEARLEGEIRDTVVPAYRRLIAFQEGLERIATDDDGVWKLPEGDLYYDRRLRSYTTTDLPADSIHSLGLREVARLQQEMRGILDANGHRGRDLRAAMNRVLEEPRFQFPANDSGRAMILDAYREMIQDANRRVDPLFRTRPRSDVVVKRVPAFREATAPGAYYQAPSIGGARPGMFYVNLRDPGETRRPEMRTLAVHEAVPGHHFQIAIAQELEGVPFFRRVIPFTAYSEGWGLYAERLAYESGFHRDAYDSLGALQAELFRAVRLVVDTGIHRQRWSRERAIEYMTRNTGMVESEVVTEVERYIVNPGQACAYKVGQLKLLELRERARERLGPRFDIRRFHDVVLTHGALPLSLLERAVKDWIALERRPGSAAGGG